MQVRKTKDTMTASLKNIQKAMAEIPAQAHQYWVAVTPRRTGNARRKTRLRGDVIDANYDYAQQLDRGSSRQAPQGMSEPTKQYIKTLADKAIRK